MKYTWAFGDDNYGVSYFYVTVNELDVHGLFFQPMFRLFEKLTK